MGRLHIQPYRNKTIYLSKEEAIEALNKLCEVIYEWEVIEEIITEDTTYNIGDILTNEVYTSLNEEDKEKCTSLNEDNSTPKDGEIVNVRYIHTDEQGKNEILSILGLFNVSEENILKVTIIENNKDSEPCKMQWEYI